MSKYKDIISPQLASYFGHEGQAASLRVFHPFLVPGLLHTEEYATSLLEAYRDRNLAPRVVDLRAERQDRLFSGTGAEFSFVVGEEALYRQVGGPNVMRRQLEHLVNMGQRSDLTIGIVPFSAGSHPGLSGPFNLLRLKETDEELLYQETPGDDQLIRDEPEKISEYSEYFETLTGVALLPDKGEALLREQISRLRHLEDA